LAVFAVGLVGDLLADRAVSEIAVAQPVEGVADVAEHRVGVVRLNADHHRAPQKAMSRHEGQYRVVELAEGHAPFLQDRAEPMLVVAQDTLVILPDGGEALARPMVFEVREGIEIVQSLEGPLGVRQDLPLPTRGEEPDTESARRRFREHVVDGDQAVQIDVARMQRDAHHQLSDDLDLDEAEVLHGKHCGVVVGVEVADLAQEFLAPLREPPALRRNQKCFVLHQLRHPHLPAHWAGSTLAGLP